MDSGYLNRAISIKKTKLPFASAPLLMPINGFIGPVIVLYIIIFEWVRNTISSLLLTSSPPQDSKPAESPAYSKVPCSINSMAREEMETVLERLGLFGLPGEREKLQERFCSKEFSEILGEEAAEEEEGDGFYVDDDEVQAAFDVFDENRDGFIDEKELQRVLCALGMDAIKEMYDQEGEGLELENCRSMIKKFDENGDGRIDLNEFSKLIFN
ncbi:unnamed protein product [Cuscuta europaea]|uniref:EF-hand domain-containing protein n=1 Tax=Cuscuta europaea TaxID=41803 RepID=A0A9P0YLE8_CUSEU|nr:unnamed protein product [Cuscuta europaea]